MFSQSETEPLLGTTHLQSDIIWERFNEIKKIEKDVIQVKEIYHDLALLTQIQGEQIITIEDGITKAGTHVESGLSQIKQASVKQKDYRRRLICFGFIVFICLSFLVLVLFLSLKNMF